MYRKEALKTAQDCSRLSDDAWLVVDCGTIGSINYRVWREQTINEQLKKMPDCVPHFEIIARVERGTIQEIA